jgi:hypothetical protein
MRLTKELPLHEMDYVLSAKDERKPKKGIAVYLFIGVD